MEKVWKILDIIVFSIRTISYSTFFWRCPFCILTGYLHNVLGPSKWSWNFAQYSSFECTVCLFSAYFSVMFLQFLHIVNTYWQYRIAELNGRRPVWYKIHNHESTKRQCHCQCHCCSKLKFIVCEADL